MKDAGFDPTGLRGPRFLIAANMDFLYIALLGIFIFIFSDPESLNGNIYTV